MDFITGIRREKLMKYILQSNNALEFGPYVRPTILPDDQVDYTTVDCFDHLSLQAYAQANGEDSESIPPVDVLIDPLSLDIPETLFGKFDLMVANHVFEHLIDPFRWLDSWGSALVDQGIFLLCIPDKKYSFDNFRSDTSLAHFISDFLNGGSESLPEHLIDLAINYDSKSRDNGDELISRLNKDFIMRSLEIYQPGVHVHVFQHEPFVEKVLKPFLRIGFVDYELIEHGALENIGEFYIVLRKSRHQSKEVDANWIFRAAEDSFPKDRIEK
jgi:hypothetical protein